MGIDVGVTGEGLQRLGVLVDSFARRVIPAVLAQHAGSSASSPLGVWLLLAACVSGAEGERQGELEDALGCSAAKASRLLAAFMASPQPALKAAIAVWVGATDATLGLSDWIGGLPGAIEVLFLQIGEFVFHRNRTTRAYNRPQSGTTVARLCARPLPPLRRWASSDLGAPGRPRGWWLV